MTRAPSPSYAAWIAEHYPDERACYGTCAEATEAMVAAFPELRRVRGHYLCAIWGERAHWWCETPTGEKVDPTAAQFPSKGFGIYTEWDDEAPEATGMCMDCGAELYNDRTFCNDRCEDSTRAYMGLPPAIRRAKEEGEVSHG